MKPICSHIRVVKDSFGIKRCLDCRAGYCSVCEEWQSERDWDEGNPYACNYCVWDIEETIELADFELMEKQ